MGKFKRSCKRKSRMFFSLIVALFGGSVIVFGQGQIIDDSFFSTAMNQDRNVDVYLPPGYDASDSTTRYPVIYFLHGAGGNQDGYVEIIQAADLLISSQAIDPLIIVKPDASGGPAFVGAYINDPLHGNLEDLIVRDLVGYIDASYHTLAQRDKRAIMGHSVGGYGCMMLALKYPDLFASVAAHSGFLDFTYDLLYDLLPCALAEKDSNEAFTSPDQGDCVEAIFNRAYSFSPNLNNPPYYVDFLVDYAGNLIDSTWAKWRLHDPSRLAAQFVASGRRDLAIYLASGKQNDFLLTMQAFADSLSQLGLGFRFDTDDGGHADQMLERFSLSVAFLDSVMWEGVIRPSRITVDHTYAEPGLDTVIVAAHVPNPSGRAIEVSARITSLDKSVEDSLPLFDDGTHGDRAAADQVWSGLWPVESGERTYSVAIRTVDVDNGLSHTRSGVLRFTTIGPVVFENFTKLRSGLTSGRKFVRGKLDLRNTSMAETAYAITATLTTRDTCIYLITQSNPSYGNILPAQTASTSGFYNIQINPNCGAVGEIAFDLTVASEGYELWHDQFTLDLGLLADVDRRAQETPQDYVLYQNYPNPFNPETTIRYELPEAVPVQLTVYNLLGQRVRTLVDEPLAAGTRQVLWDGKDDSGLRLPSGPYVYRLESGTNVLVRKMVLLQ